MSNKIKIILLILLLSIVKMPLIKAIVNEEGDSNFATSSEITPATDETGTGVLLISLNAKDGFTYAVTVKVQNISSLQVNEIQLSSSNKYYERVTLDAGNYTILDASVNGDLSNKYPIESGMQFSISSSSTITEVNLNFKEKTSEQSSNTSSVSSQETSSSVSSSIEENKKDNSWIIVLIGLVSFFIVLVLIIKFKNK